MHLPTVKLMPLLKPEAEISLTMGQAAMAVSTWLREEPQQPLAFAMVLSESGVFTYRHQVHCLIDSFKTSLSGPPYRCYETQRLSLLNR